MPFESLPRAKNTTQPIGAIALLLIAAAQVALTAAPAFRPSKYLDGTLPPLPPTTVVGGGEVMLEVDVTSAGAVRGVRTLRTTRPYTEALIAATKTWRFAPAEIEVEPPPPPGQPRFRAVDSTVLVTAVFLAPSLIGPTLGDLPRDVGSESDSTPFPFSTTPPLFPPRARDAGLVLIETTIDTGGQPTANKILRSSPAFDEAALTALRQWRFRPARVGGSSTPTLAYVIVGFRQPALAGGSAGPR
jgi:periplasmic protein TonB